MIIGTNWTKWGLTALAISGIGIEAYAQSGSRYEGYSGGPKVVIVDKANQELRAYEGDSLVLRTNISTGRPGKETPNGRYSVRGKKLMHYSSLYDNAPMPYSVHVAGNYFIHGYSSVPSFPASHGCVRVPLSGDNPARRFYQWVNVGTPVRIVGNWQPTRSSTPQKQRKERGFRLFGSRASEGTPRELQAARETQRRRAAYIATQNWPEERAPRDW
jgi:hypothetical protein